MKYVWVFFDYAQAEGRVVAWRGPIPAMKSWFLEGRDTHLETAKLIGRIVQENKIRMPKMQDGHLLFSHKPWQEFTKADFYERDIGKKSNHADNYGLGRFKYSLMTGLPLKEATMLQNVHHALFPEIKKGYQKWIEDCINKNRTIVTPWGWSYTFYYYDIITPELYRAGYALYPQSTIGDLLVFTMTELCELFAEELPEASVMTPQAIRKRGLDVQLQIHDAAGIVCPDDAECIDFVCKKAKEKGEIPIIINNEPLVIPMDFKVGPTWGDAKDFEVIHV